MYNVNKIFFIGNLDSNLFRTRLSVITNDSELENYKVINTSRKKITNVIKFIYDSVKLFVHCLIYSETKIIFHGAYNSILWLLVLINKNFVISILQGSELEKDYTKLRFFFINLILKKSKLIVCRSQRQLSFVKNNINCQHSKVLIVNWGLSYKLFDLNKKKSHKSINIISPRASQNEYNINIIFDAITRLKEQKYQVRFTYIKFNSKIKIKNIKVADKIIDSPKQDQFWDELINSDICISIPDYDGFSNTILESLALGNYVILSNLEPYKFIKKHFYLGKIIHLEDNYNKTVKSLYLTLIKTIKNIDDIRSNSNKRRTYIKNNYLNKKNFDFMLKIINK